MKIWITQHVLAVRAALGKLAAQRATSLLNVLVIGVAISLPAGGYVLLANLQGVAQRFSLEPQLSVILEAACSPSDRDALERRLKAERHVAKVRFVSREVALQELRKTEGMAEVIAALNQNPLPDAFVVGLRDILPSALDALAADLGKQPGVAQVQVDSVWARRLAALITIGRLGMGLLAALLATGLVAVTFNTIRLQILTQREEIDVSRLLGATDGFIRRPFYYLGALQGLAGGLVGLAVLAGSLAMLNKGVLELAEAYGSTFRFEYLATADALSVGVFASVLGWLGAYLSVSIYLREIAYR